jgi:hypothetical protein
MENHFHVNKWPHHYLSSDENASNSDKNWRVEQYQQLFIEILWVFARK